MKAFFSISQNKLLLPHNEETREYVSKLQVGTVISADIKKARNYENHKRFFAFIKITFDMQEFFTEIEAYRYWLTMKCGWFDTIVAPNGFTIFKAKSISFESMDEIEFNKLFSSAIDVFLESFGKDVSYDDLLQAVSFS